MKTGVQFIRFSIIGGLNTLLHYIVFILLFRFVGVDMILASALGYSVGILNSFILNRNWTFNISNKVSLKEFFKFLIVNLVSMGGNLLTLKVLVTGLNIIPEAAQALAIMASLILNFVGNKFWTFRIG